MLAAERGAVILAHNYQLPEVQQVADFVGDSLGLSQQAARTDAGVIAFCGVHFMAETASILSPDKTVLLPDLDAGCSLAASITADQLRDWKAEHPGAVVVSYVNTTAEVKAESDYCCTSGNAKSVIEAIPEDREILFLPDLFLGVWLDSYGGDGAAATTLNFYWTARIVSGTPEAADDVAELRWFEPDEIAEDDLAFPHTLEVLSALRRQQQA